MSLTSYRTAPPRGNGFVMLRRRVAPRRPDFLMIWLFAASSGSGIVNARSAARRPVLGRPGGDLLSHALRRSTIGAEAFHGRVRNGIGCFALAIATRPSKDRRLVRPRSAPGARQARLDDLGLEVVRPRRAHRKARHRFTVTSAARRLALRETKDQADRAISTG